MDTLYRFQTPPHQCSYLPDQAAELEYEIVARLSPTEYQKRLRQGWRRFGYSLFHPQCRSCRECKSLRVVVEQFQPNRSQQRALAANVDVAVKIGRPKVTRQKLDLYDRYHLFQSQHVGWVEHGPKERADYVESFVANPFPTEEWCYYVGDHLVGVGYVDTVPEGLSAIYFFYEPEQRDRSLGTLNVLRIIESAAERGLPHVYLGYFVAGCRSLEYKARFRANETLGPSGEWAPFRA
jgi:arginine-tRNA-protein transferase